MARRISEMRRPGTRNAHGARPVHLKAGDAIADVACVVIEDDEAAGEITQAEPTPSGDALATHPAVAEAPDES